MLLAHAGHILIDGPLFGGPVLILVVVLWAMGKAEQRREARGEGTAEPDAG